jgi:hypothetical protein
MKNTDTADKYYLGYITFNDKHSFENKMQTVHVTETHLIKANNTEDAKIALTKFFELNYINVVLVNNGIRIGNTIDANDFK